MADLFVRISPNRHSSRQEVAVACLQANWRQDLLAAVRAVLNDETLNFAQALHLLRDFDGQQFLALDRSLRGRSRWHDFAVRDTQSSTAPERDDDADAGAFLWVAATHGSGYVREQALQHFLDYPCPLGLSAAIMRTDDWVPEVQRASLKLFRQLMQTKQAAALFQLLDLVRTMQGKQRFAAIWSQSVEPHFVAPEHRDARWQALSRGSGATRLFAYQLLVRADPDRILEALRQAMGDHCPAVAHWALTQSRTSADAKTQRELILAASRHRLAALRATAIRRIGTSDYTDAPELLRSALFDRSRAPRNAAAHYLQHRFAEPAAPHWRAAVDRGEHVAAAILGLSEHGSSQDIERLTRHRQHAASVIRIAVLRGLWHAGDPQLSQYLYQALQDRSLLVVRHAVALLERLPEGFEVALLADAIERCSRAASRGVLLSAAIRLPQWEGLALLLQHLATSPSSEQSHIAACIDRWSVTANRRFAPLPPTARALLTSQLARVRGLMPHSRWRDLSQLLAAR